jgi:hypothetical protein
MVVGGAVGRTMIDLLNWISYLYTTVIAEGHGCVRRSINHFVEGIDEMIHLGRPFGRESTRAQHSFVAMDVSARKTPGAVKDECCLTA